MIISVRKEGIANRMKSLVSCFRLEPESSFVYWDPIINIYHRNNFGEKVPHRPACEFNDLFENKISINHPFPEEARIHNSWRLSVLPTDKIANGFSQSKFSDADPNGRNIDFMYNQIPKKIRYSYIEEFEKLIIKKELKKKVNDKLKEIDGDFISIHLRTWYDEAGRKRRNPEQFNRFAGEMLNYKGAKFFVGSDDKNIVMSLKKIFPGRIYHTSLEEKDRTTPNDLVDLYILSKGLKIIGTENSTFTEVIWWVANCPKYIKVI